MKLANGEDLNTRVLALNTNACYNLNFYLIANATDPAGELNWLEKQLAQLEKENKFAIIIGHIPPGRTCIHSWAARFNSLVERYQHVIRGMYYGHTHYQEFSVVRGINDFKPIMVNYIDGSATTFTNLNPSFVVYDVDRATMLPIE